MTKLPEVENGMRLDRALFLELLHILVEEKILTEEKAVKRYRMRFDDEA